MSEKRLRYFLSLLLITILSVGQSHAQQGKKLDSDKLLKRAQAETRNNRYSEAIVLAKTGLSVSPKYTDIRLLLARLYILTGDLKNAETEYGTILRQEPRNIDAQIGLAKVYELVKKYKEAFLIYQSLSNRYPYDTGYLIKQVGLLELQKDFLQASRITYKLRSTYPNKVRFKLLDEYIQISVAELYKKEDKYDSATLVYNNVLKSNPENADAIVGLAKMNEVQGNYATALQLYDRRYKNDQSDTTYLLKKIGLLDALGRYEDAISTMRKLKALYTGNVKYQDIDNYLHLKLGSRLELADSLKLALAVYDETLKNAPGEETALKSKARVLEKLNRYNEAMEIYNTLLIAKPTDSAYLLKKSYLYELQGKYDSASNASKLLVTTYPDNRRFESIYRYQKYKIQKDNQVGVLHLQSFFDNGMRTANITSIQYLRRFNESRSAVIGRINYGNRQQGDGVQFEVESYLYHDKNFYSLINVGYSGNIIFPKIRASYSLYPNLHKGWEGEIGVRYINVQDANIYSGVIGISKYYDNDWFTLRNFIIKDSANWYHSHVATWRHFVNEKRDYLSLIVGLGTSPDDRSRNYERNNFSNFIAKSIGVGYNFKVASQSIFQITTVLNNQKLPSGKYYNQFDFYINFLQNF